MKAADFVSCRRGASFLVAMFLLLPSLQGTADASAPLRQGPDLVQVPEPLPDSSSLVTPQEPLPPAEPEGLPLAPFRLLRATDEVEILETVDRWLLAWWRQKVDDYLSFYAKDFEVPENLDRRAWEEQRRVRLVAPAFITIDIEAREITALSEHQYRAQFIQHYRSDTYQDTVLKVLELIRENGRWKIQREESKLPLLPSTQANL